MAPLPYAVILQVTPVIAIAPLILIWVGYEHVERAAVIIALIVAFFPILSNATLGLRSVDPGFSISSGSMVPHAGRSCGVSSCRARCLTFLPA